LCCSTMPKLLRYTNGEAYWPQPLMADGRPLPFKSGPLGPVSAESFMCKVTAEQRDGIVNAWVAAGQPTRGIFEGRVRSCTLVTHPGSTGGVMVLPVGEGEVPEKRALRTGWEFTWEFNKTAKEGKRRNRGRPPKLDEEEATVGYKSREKWRDWYEPRVPARLLHYWATGENLSPPPPPRGKWTGVKAKVPAKKKGNNKGLTTTADAAVPSGA
jgi:hypothetical protein